MYGVELYAAVRLAVVDEGLSHHEVGRRFGIDRRTVKKMLSYSAPPGRRQPRGGRAVPRAGPSHGLRGQAAAECGAAINVRLRIASSENAPERRSFCLTSMFPNRCIAGLGWSSRDLGSCGEPACCSVSGSLTPYRNPG